MDDLVNFKIMPYPGMSLRDWFAGLAMQALVSTELSDKMAVVGAYEIADAMLAERAKVATLPPKE